MDIFQVFYDNRDEDQAEAMANYMRNLFLFLGIKKPERTRLSREFLKDKKREDKIDWDFIFKCYKMPEREFQYLAIEYMNKIRDLFTYEDMAGIERLAISKSWWDSVDALNPLVGYIAEKYPAIKDNILLDWIEADNIWLNRLSIIFQLKYKKSTDTEFLKMAILYNSTTDEFFINKAIGWALREYSKSNKEWVKDFIENNKLSSLSVREASKYL